MTYLFLLGGRPIMQVPGNYAIRNTQSMQQVLTRHPIIESLCVLPPI